MRVLVGTSGYSYKEWKPGFYPEKLASREFLRFYAERLPTVEINNTFYRMPTDKLLAGWASEVSDAFVFALKAPQRITHIAKLKDAEELTASFVRTAAGLGGRLGPLLFQLPPFLKKDVPRLAAFLSFAVQLPQRPKLAFEFRHPSWFEEDALETLRTHGAALCVAEGEGLASPLTATTTWGYVRLRRDAYPDSLIADWAQRIREQAWTEAFVYLKHDEGNAPQIALKLTMALAAPPSDHEAELLRNTTT